jgi:hypothetical protein
MDLTVNTPGAKPEMPVEVPPEVKAMNFTFDPTQVGTTDDNSTITSNGVTLKQDDGQTTPAPKAEDKTTAPAKTEDKSKTDSKAKTEEPAKSVLTPPADETKVKPKVEDKSKVPEGKIKPITPVKESKSGEQTDTFDYSKFSQQDQINLKNMSRQSREAYVKLLDENKQLASLKDATFLQHEQAYTLSPEFRDLQQKNHLVRTEGRAWQDALLKIKSGEPFAEITGFDNNGNPTFAAPRQATAADEIRIQQNLMKCGQVIDELGNKLNTYPTQFKSRVEQDLNAIRQEEVNRFAWVQDPKLLDYTLEVDGQGTKKIREIRENFASLFPAYLRSNPAVSVASNLMVALMIQSAELKEARAGRQVAEIKREEVSRGEPSSSSYETQEVSELAKKGVPKNFTLAGSPFERD